MEKKTLKMWNVGKWKIEKWKNFENFGKLEIWKSEKCKNRNVQKKMKIEK